MNWILSIDGNDLPGEMWKDVLGFEERYEVSNFGRVKSWVKKRPQILRKTISSGKYKVLLYRRRGMYENVSVGRLVASAFIREPEENEVLRYKDGNCLKDFANNVYWESRKGVPNLKNSGNSHGMAKLDGCKVTEIKIFLNQGIGLSDLSKKYNVSYNTIHAIKKGRSWKNQ